ncbi:hypothetical protein OJF2_61100 [Aquisphaera giovannonii]|uniref:Uncharacterized protein n=1 Tax=Aquisphaera giovannonii TaxID=406548 RepID=A0A5B9WB75_9BACT|nr:hypothetical protein [Aquisphaera giovannonii]QEH37519.1 hypothetical protein OJF2_61100 [Aquisphaera giovannonii]
MRPWINWLAGAGLAAACMASGGCGGGDVPDPGSDAAAANDAAPAGEGAPQPESTPPAAAAPVAPVASGPAAPAAGDDGKAGDEPTAASDAAPAATGAASAKAEGGSTTAEMLALATASQPAPPSSGAGDAQGQGGGAPSAYPGAGGSGGPMSSSYPNSGSRGPAGYPGAGGGAPSGYPGAAGGSGPMASAYPGMGGNRSNGPAGYPGAGGSGGPMSSSYPNSGSRGPSGYPGAGGSGAPTGYPGGPGGMMGGSNPGGNQDNGPATTETPEGAVRAFLKAVAGKDRDGLMEATALRAAQTNNPVESVSPKNAEFFGKILDGSISDTELDDLNKKFDGYKIAGVNAVKSTGKLGIYIQKTTDDGDTHRRTITVRKEKKGWGVMDIGGEILFKGMGGQRRTSKR